MTKEQAYTKIADLVERFGEQLVSYKKAEYNDTLTRRDFIDPFFKALGWDMDNSNGYAESYREVIHKAKIKIGGATKAPDYSFRPGGGKVLFFVEAKKPNVAVKDEVLPAYQIRRYVWSAGLAISIITDFEEFAVYDCAKKPFVTDKASTARIRYITFKDYLKEFDFLWETFSKEAVLKGGLDKFIAKDTSKKGTAAVDKDFLLSLDHWRTLLATDICKKNKTLNEDEINYAVQQTIDRLIFLRIAEGRGAEPYAQLQDSVKHGAYYNNLFQLFQNADDKYNSGIFDFKKDVISGYLVIDNKVIKTIINNLYYPESPYEFSVLPVEILGSAYEQFLGKQIKVDHLHRAKIEEKPEVRKAGGVYYTPQYIVDYIVQNTVGKLTEGKTPKEVSQLKIVDPACGSGSFLIGAYRYLLDWHKNFYTHNGKLQSNSPVLRRGIKGDVLSPDGNLTTAEKKRILLNNIYGVDIDVNAVEVTKLSLLLTCMEGETTASIANQLSMFNERVLPTLENNIKSGNSLIDTDFYDTQIDFGEEKKIKPFNWKKAFPDVFKRKAEKEEREDLTAIAQKARHHAQKTLDYVNQLDEKLNQVSEPSAAYETAGGFDAVIGNPPYLGGREWKETNGNVSTYFVKKYSVAEYQFDIYALFWEAGITLLRPNGMIGYITPNTWLNNQSNTKLRAFILTNTRIVSIADYSQTKVFDQATVLPIITILENSNSKNKLTEIFLPVKGNLLKISTINQNIWQDDDLNIININLDKKDLDVRSKIEGNTVLLKSLALIKFGIKLYETGKGNPKQKPGFAKEHVYEASTKIDKSYRPYLEGKDINPYRIDYKNRWLKYGENLAAPRDPVLFEGDRILVRRIVGKTLISAYTNSNYVTSQLLQIVKPNNSALTKFLLGILNSNLLAFYFRKKFNRQDKTFPEIRIYELASLPIKIINDSNCDLKDQIARLADQLLQLNLQITETRLHTAALEIKSKIDYCEEKINYKIYELYELTEDEIRIIEEA